MANLFTVPAGQLNAFTGKLAEAGLTAEIVRAANTNPDIVRAMVEAAQRVVETAERNPFEQPVEDQIAALRLANTEEGWGISAETFARLAATAPAWPQGRDSYRFFRIRFGTGDEGVARTFEAHADRIKRVHGDRKFCRWEYLRSDKKHLRLLAGSHTHKPVVEWCIVQLDANRRRESIEAVRGPKSLADEGLVLAWLFPRRVGAIDYDTWCAWFLGGYEINVPESEESWQLVLRVYRYLGPGAGEVNLCADWRGNDYSDYSVPSSGE